MIFVRSDDVFAPEVLNAIDRLGSRLKAEVPYADELTSITNLSIPKITKGGLSIINPYKDFYTSTYEGIKEMKDFILSRHSLNNNLVSDDCTETWVLLSLHPYENSDSNSEMLKVGKAAYDIIHSDEFKSETFTLSGAGISYTEYCEDAVTSHECVIRICIGFFVMILSLILFVRSVCGLIVPVLATVFGICVVLGFSGWFGITANTTLILIPVLLGMALSVGYSIHYINDFRLDSVIKSVEETGWPILFTVITTVASMISFMLSGIEPVRWVGGICASVVFITYIYVIVLIPIFMSFGKDKQLVSKTTSIPFQYIPTKADLIFEKSGLKIINSKWITVIVSAVIVIVSVPGIFKMTVNMDYMETMGKKIPYVHELAEILDSKLGSQYSYNVLIEFDKEGAFKSSDVLKRLDVLEEKLGTLKLTKIAGNEPKITSVTDIVKEINFCLHADKDEFYCIPDKKSILAAELTMYKSLNDELLSKWVDRKYKSSYIHVDLNGYNAKIVIEDIEKAINFAREIFPDAKVAIIGDVVNYAAMNEKLVVGELKAFFSSFIMIALLMIVAFGSFTTGLIGMIPNVAPVIFIGAVMGYSKTPLDMITMTVMPMILGIAVDDTIHFINRSKLEFEKTGNYKEAVKITFREIGKTLGMTTFILCAMFAVFMTSPMTALFRIVFLTIVGLSSALLADYTLTPVLIYITKPFGKEKNK